MYLTICIKTLESMLSETKVHYRYWGHFFGQVRYGEVKSSEFIKAELSCLLTPGRAPRPHIAMYILILTLVLTVSKKFCRRAPHRDIVLR